MMPEDNLEVMKDAGRSGQGKAAICAPSIASIYVHGLHEIGHAAWEFELDFFGVHGPAQRQVLLEGLESATDCSQPACSSVQASFDLWSSETGNFVVSLSEFEIMSSGCLKSVAVRACVCPALCCEAKAG